MNIVANRSISILGQNQDLNLVYPNNFISNCKYSTLNFLPINLLEQFSRLEILWFFFISLLQLLPFDLSPFGSTSLTNYGTILPLCFIVLVSTAKDWYNARKIIKSDRIINSQKVQVVEDVNGKVNELKWEDIKVGSVVILQQDQFCPADLLLIASSIKDGLAFVETSNLDGEIRLQQKETLRDFQGIYENSRNSLEAIIRKLKDATLDVEQPNSRLYEFEGTLNTEENTAHSFNIQNFLLRGSRIKNVEQVVGIVVFTGPDTKLMQNTQILMRKKCSKAQKKLSQFSFFIIIEIWVLASISAVLAAVSFKYGEQVFYGETLSDNRKSILTFLILYNNLIPVSLFVTLDIVKLVQARFIENDEELKSDCFESKQISVKNSDINDELGQIDYILTDKTGTLTENQLKFSKCWVNGRYFTEEELSIKNFNTNRTNINNFEDALDLFWTCVGTCHATNCDSISYKSLSPDEIALVTAASNIGYKFCSNGHDMTKLEKSSEVLHYNVIGINKFTSERKRMSVVIKFYPCHNLEPMLICKGADSAVVPLLNDLSSHEDILTATSEMAKEGLRTLVYGFTFLTEAQLKEFDDEYKKIENSMLDNKTLLEKLGDKYEKNLNFVGISGIEDKIIEGVANAVKKLKKTGVKIWVLTGDKKETAENVVYAAGIIDPSTKMIYIEENDSKALLMHLLKLVLYQLYPHRAEYEIFEEDSIENLKSTFKRMQKTQDINPNLNEFYLVINGSTLAILFKDLESLKFFTILSTLASSVIFCRMIPFQKAQVVKMIKEHFRNKPTVLAVGDGSNDVSMIQEANVGVGIFGREGLQAANSSDFAICEFPKLVPLLKDHGRNNYLRTAKIIYFSLFKNSLAIFPLFYFSFVSYYSGSCPYDMWLILAFNIFFTFLPVAVVGLYEKGNKFNSKKKIKLLRWKTFLFWKFFAAAASILLFSVVLLDRKSKALDDSFKVDGTLLFITVVLTSLAVFMIETVLWNKQFLMSVLFSIIALVCITVGYDYSQFPSSSLEGVLNMLLKIPKNITMIFLLPLIVIILPLFQLCWKDCEEISSYSAILPESKYTIFDSTSLLQKYSKKISSLFIRRKRSNLIRTVPNQVKNDYARKKFRLEFKNTQIEKSFLKFRAERSQSYVSFMLFLIFLGNLSWILFDWIKFGKLDSMMEVRIGLIGLIFILMVISRTEEFKKRFELGVILMICGALLVKTIVEYLFKLDGSMSTATGSIITFIILRANTYKVFPIWMLYLLIYLIRIYIMYYSNHSFTQVEILIVYYSVILTGISLISAYIGYCIENSIRDSYTNIRKCDEKYKTGKRIMARLLPEDIIEDIKQKKNIVKASNVTIMFCEIMNFDEIVTKMKPEALMDMLNKYILLMDGLCENNHITKVETVNKTYVACCGLKENQSQLSHALNMVKFAVKVIENFEAYFLPDISKNFELRIGINTGEIISGVICDHKPQYCLVGDTMNIASRMCTTIKTPNLIRISESTYNQVHNIDGFTFEKEKISFKGKEGSVDTYLVVTKRSGRPRRSHEFGHISAQSLLQRNQEVRESQNSVPRRSASVFEIENLRTDDFKRNEISYYLVDNNSKESLFSEEIQWNILTYDEIFIQRKYREDFILRNKLIIKRGLIFTIVVNSFIEVVYISHYSILTNKKGFPELSCIILRGLFILFLFLLYIFQNRLISSRSYQYLIPILYSFKVIIEVFTTFLKFEVSYIIIIETMYSTVAFNHISGLLFGYILAGSLTQATFWTLAARHHLITYFDQLFFILFFITINLVASRSREKHDRESYNLKIKALAEIESTEKLLKQMIPEKVYENLQQGKPVLDNGKGVSVLYADICGFTAFSGKRHPQDIVRILSHLFSEFEKFTIECKCYKVHTIGDCYVALGVPDITNFDVKSTKNLIELALKMVNKLKEFKVTNALNMRIGIHTGCVTAGIVGTKIVRYDIYGSDVDIANLVETAGMPGRVNVSQNTKDLLDMNFEGEFEFEENKNVYHGPSDTTMMTYLLVDRKNKKR